MLTTNTAHAFGHCERDIERTRIISVEAVTRSQYEAALARKSSNVPPKSCTLIRDGLSAALRGCSGDCRTCGCNAYSAHSTPGISIEVARHVNAVRKETGADFLPVRVA